MINRSGPSEVNPRVIRVY